MVTFSHLLLLQVVPDRDGIKSINKPAFFTSVHVTACLHPNSFCERGKSKAHTTEQLLSSSCETPQVILSTPPRKTVNFTTYPTLISHNPRQTEFLLKLYAVEIEIFLLMDLLTYVGHKEVLAFI